MIKKFIVTLFILLTTLFNVQAQKLENALLWEISGNNLKKPSYLYGTIHITCDASLDNNIKKALDKTSRLVLELDMDDPNIQTSMLQYIGMKNGKTIKDMLNKEEYDLLNTFVLNNIGAPLTAFNTTKPFFITAALYPKMIHCGSSLQSFEEELMKVALAQKEEVLGLETVAEQMQIFDEIPYEEQLKDLLKSAKDNLESDKALFKEMLVLYNEKDLNGLERITNEDETYVMSEHREKMLDNRNKNWISKIEDLAKEEPTFFGVGAAHLPGENGIITLLRKEGYTVTAVK